MIDVQQDGRTEKQDVTVVTVQTKHKGETEESCQHNKVAWLKCAHNMSLYICLIEQKAIMT